MQTPIRSTLAIRPGDPRWSEFIERLAGPEGCDFREDPAWSWVCHGGRDKRFSAAILAAMGFSPAAIRASLSYFERQGGYCDCEVVFNVGSRQGLDLAHLGETPSPSA